MDQKTRDKIRSMAGAPATKTAGSIADLDEVLIADLIKGAAQNPQLARVQLARAGLAPIALAKYAGALVAYEEAGLSVKEACELSGLDQATLQALAVVSR